MNVHTGIKPPAHVKNFIKYDVKTGVGITKIKWPDAPWPFDICRWVVSFHQDIFTASMGSNCVRSIKICMHFLIQQDLWQILEGLHSARAFGVSAIRHVSRIPKTWRMADTLPVIYDWTRAAFFRIITLSDAKKKLKLNVYMTTLSQTVYPR